MKKYYYKIIVILFLIVSIITLLVLCFTGNSSIVSVIENLSINLIASCLIISLINMKIDNDKEKELEERRKIIYKSLINPIRDYDGMIYNMYKATSKKKDIIISTFTNSNYVSIEKRIIKLNLFSDGYLYDINLSRTLKWIEIINNVYFHYIESLKQFYNYNSHFIDNELSDFLYKIIRNESLKMISNQLCSGKYEIDAEKYFKIIKPLELYDVNKKIINKIKKYVDVSSLDINNSNILTDGAAPNYESGIK